MHLKLKSMRSRTTLGFMVIIGVVLLCSITGLTTMAQNNAEYDNTQILKKVADDGAKALNDKNWHQELEALAASPEVAEHNITIVAVQSPRPPGGPERDGNRPRDRGPRWTMSDVIYHSRADFPGPYPRSPNPLQKTKEQIAFENKYSTQASFAGRGRLVIASRLNVGVAREIQRRRFDMLVIGGLVVLMVGVGAWLLVGLTLSPIRKLARQAASASAENLSVRLEPPSNDAEVVDLVNMLNVFLTRFAETAESKGRFYAAASHELRTPLQALSGHLELALSRERTAEEYRSALEEAKKQSGRLKSLVQSLLLLHQLENNAERERDEVNIASICRATLQQLNPIVTGRKLLVSIDIPADATVSAISNHAEILVRNLLENAAKYATEGKAVSISFRPEGDGNVLEIFDECEPIPGWSSDKASEAFYRPDHARNAKTGGNGLGLAICRAVAHADGWELQIEQVENGFMARVVFPGQQVAQKGPARRTKEKPVVGPAVADNPAS